MEKGDYSVNDIKNLFKIKYFKVGDILFFRNADIVKDYGSTYDIEIKVRVAGIDNEGNLRVECIEYFDGFNKIHKLSFGTPHTVEKNDFKYLFRKSLNF